MSKVKNAYVYVSRQTYQCEKIVLFLKSMVSNKKLHITFEELLKLCNQILNFLMVIPLKVVQSDRYKQKLIWVKSYNEQGARIYLLFKMLNCKVLGNLKIEDIFVVITIIINFHSRTSNDDSLINDYKM